MRRTRIFTPGPTPLMPEAQVAMARPLIHHRSREFAAAFLQTRKQLQELFRTENDLVVLTSSGTGAMEAAVANLLGPEDQALAVVAGKFGERWARICRAFQVPCTPLRKQLGEAVGPDEINRELAADPAITAVLLQGCETSTATSFDLEAIGRKTREAHPNILLIVDAITALGSQAVETDSWGLDVVVGSSQKSFGMSPGLAFLSISHRAIRKMEGNAGRRFYFDLLGELNAQKRGQTAYTPAITLLEALNATSGVLANYGLQNLIRDTEVIARTARTGLQALGFRLVSERPANALTAVYPPRGIDADRLKEHLQWKHGLIVAGGQGSLRGKIIRIAHLGSFDLLDVFSVLSAVELSLAALGHPVEPALGLRAAMIEAIPAELTSKASNS